MISFFSFNMKNFPKKEKLNSKIKIDNLFRSKNTFTYNKIKVHWIINSSVENQSETLISVPKKIIPLSTKRNKIKRLIRESYRLNKNILQLDNQGINISFMFLSSEIPEYNSLEGKIKVILHRLNDKL
jgi:ribonuclease P protein component